MSSNADLANLITRLETIVQRLEQTGGSGGSGSGDAADARYVEEFDVFVTDYVEPYLAASATLGGAVDLQAKCLKSIVDEQRKFLVIASKCSAPKDASVIMKLAAAMSDNMGKMESFKKKMTNDERNHVSAACEGVVVFSWVVYPKTPMKHVEESKNSVEFYTNKVLTAYKNGDKAAEHKAWVRAYLKVFDGLLSYIKDHHRTGLSWNAKAPPATESSGSMGGASAKGIPPPPPAGVPPPPPVSSTTPVAQSAPAPAADSMDKVFESIRQGTEITKGLKKVTNDMKTYKNPDLRKHGPVPFKAKEPTGYKPMGKPKAAKMPPKLVLEGKKWIVEFQENQNNLVIDKTEMKQTIYVYKCVKSALIVKGKVNSIVLDSCQKLGVAFESVVSGVEVINSDSIKVQAQGTMPNVSIDKTDGCLVYLSKECLDCQIVSAKSSEMNVSRPKDDGSGDYDEYPISEQFRTFWDKEKKTFVSQPAEQMG